MQNGYWLCALIVCCILPGPPCGAAEQPQLLSVEKIWDAGPHNAFTDLIRFQDRWYCTFREADGHVGGDGGLRVLASDDGRDWQAVALLTEQGIDLRDPKFSIAADGRLMITAGGSVYEGGRTLLGMQPRVAFSANGRDWTSPRRILSEGQWLWRTTWHRDQAYGVAYGWQPGASSDERSLKLVASSNGVDWRTITELDVPGRPNETTLRFLPDDTMVALVRREADDRQAWIGLSRPPYEQWTWHTAGERVGGPNFIRLPDGSLWGAGRRYEPTARTFLARMTLDSYRPALELPSGGDNSYPGLVWHDGLLWMSYYSSHDGKSNIYLARIRVPLEAGAAGTGLNHG